jgi:hypothetical protein
MTEFAIVPTMPARITARMMRSTGHAPCVRRSIATLQHSIDGEARHQDDGAEQDGDQAMSTPGSSRRQLPLEIFEKLGL